MPPMPRVCALAQNSRRSSSPRASAWPIETVRNWEQGKRSPRGPARALLKMIDKAPEIAFAVLGSGKPVG